MSYNWALIRGGSANPSSLKYTALMNKQTLAENELFKPERQEPQIISTHTEDLVLIQDPFMFTKLKPVTLIYKGPFEPDGVHLKLWCKFNHIAKEMRDMAFSVNLEDYPYLPGLVLKPHGNPKLCEGPDFDGIKGGSIVTKINSNPNIIDYYTISNPASMNFGIQPSFDLNHVGISIFFRFMLEGEPVQDNGVDPTLWYHAEELTTFGSMIRIGTNRELKFFIKKSGSTFNFISPNNAVVPNVWTTACLTYKFSDNAMTMTINNVPQTDSADETPTFDHVDNNVVIGASQYPFNAGRFVGRLDDVRWYSNLIFNRDHETNIWNNGRSICAASVLSFDGVNDYIDLLADTGLWSRSLDKFSFSIWINPTTIHDINYRNIMAIGDGNDEVYLSYNSPTQLELGVSKDAYVTAGYATTTLANTTNKWHNIIGTYDKTLGSNNLKLYHNGALVSQANYAFTLAIASTAKMLLGRYEFDAPSSFQYKGAMKDFRWWYNTELTQAQVIAVRDNRTDAPLPSYWLKMGEGNGNPTDFITRTKVGTLTNGALWTIGSSPHPIGFGSLSVVGYARFNENVYAGGYDSTGFDSTGFDTT
ncbi:LamG-like jellyroll fold domain-containing protein [Serratia sp. (in: enterobacteria)]|uniref:LamG domain-containing protein n=1 Tax=Serratia sp. (in: enterobacteria) TaxID=616 RepID=UPI003989E15A